MKRHILTAIILIASYAANAQFTAGLDGGLSVPASDYGSKSLPSPNSTTINGYAKLGTCFDGYVGFKFIPLIGGMLQYGVNTNSNNVSTLNTSNTTYTSGGSDKITEYLIGPFFSIKLIKIKIEAKLLAGLVSSNYPTLSSSSSSTTFGGVTSSVENSFTTGNSFGYCAGAKIKYMMASVLGIGLGLDYVGSDVNFKGTNSLNGESTNYKMSVGVLQATLGVSLDL
jgi:hypothetical protein